MAEETGTRFKYTKRIFVIARGNKQQHHLIVVGLLEVKEEKTNLKEKENSN